MREKAKARGDDRRIVHNRPGLVAPSLLGIVILARLTACEGNFQFLIVVHDGARDVADGLGSLNLSHRPLMIGCCNAIVPRVTLLDAEDAITSTD